MPTFVVKLFVEARGIGAIPEIDESVAQVAAVLKIDRQVEEVVAAAVALVQHGEQHFLAVLVRNVPDHERRAWWGAHIAARLRQVKRVLLIGIPAPVLAPLPRRLGAPPRDTPVARFSLRDGVGVLPVVVRQLSPAAGRPPATPPMMVVHRVEASAHWWGRGDAHARQRSSLHLVGMGGRTAHRMPLRPLLRTVQSVLHKVGHV
mmetsp:Transcript_11849/g.21383  ORF Transcript_11849/g.21383 Transcript_11849/m.21383 type:complete len:204 (+) Transcript_11849:952-1563(+)